MHHFCVFVFLKIGKEIAANNNKDVFRNFCRKTQSEQLGGKRLLDISRAVRQYCPEN